MKNIVLSISFFLIMQAIILSMPNFLFGGGWDSHDTLIFDGESSVLHSPYDISSLGCEIRVLDAHCYKGNVLVRKIYTGCGDEDIDTVWEVNKEVELKAGDLLQSGSQVNSSCKNGYASIDVILIGPYGNKITVPYRMGNGTGGAGMTMPNIYNLCYQARTKTSIPEEKTEIKEGKVFIDIDQNAKKMFDDVEKMIQDINKSLNMDIQGFSPFTFNTARTITSHKGTKFSIEIVVDGSDTSDVIKVYEGSGDC